MKTPQAIFFLKPKYWPIKVKVPHHLADKENEGN
jgi:hypothetical protein